MFATGNGIAKVHGVEENYAGIEWDPRAEPVYPVDFDELRDEVAEWLEAAPRKRSTNGARRKATPSDNGHETTPCPQPVELILYVSSHSLHSAAAIRTVKQVLSRFQRSRVKLTVRDLTEDPTLGAADSVAFTPTLVRRSPLPRTFILGHLSNPALLLDLLADCEETEN